MSWMCVLYCIVLYCIVLYCMSWMCVLYCIVLFCIVLYCIVLYCIVLYVMDVCIVLYCFVLYCIVCHGCVYCIVLFCIVLYCMAWMCVLYCIVLYCIVLYCILLYCIVLYVMDVCIVLYVHFTHCSTVHTCVRTYIQMVVEGLLLQYVTVPKALQRSHLNMYCKYYLGTSPHKTKVSTFQLDLSMLPAVHNGMCSTPSLTTCWHAGGHSWRGSHGSHCKCGVGAARQCRHVSGRTASLCLASLPVPFLSAVHLRMDTHMLPGGKATAKGNVLIPLSIFSTFLV